MKKSKLTVIAGVIVTFLAATVVAGGVWKFHDPPFDFLFGNHIDTHQETKLNAKGELKGFLYIRYMDMDGDGEIDYTDDGLPMAHHCTKEEHYENNQCVVGWKIRGKPCIEEFDGCQAMMLYHYHDHPVWLIGPRLDHDGELRGTRSFLPQPGTYVGHYHWITEGSEHVMSMDGKEMTMGFPSSIDQIESALGIDIEVDPACNVAMAKKLTPGTICPGYFLKLKAVRSFSFMHGGEHMDVRVGIDMRSHLNVVTSYRHSDISGEGLPEDEGTDDGDSHH